jgi:hypothetical protein
MVSIWQSKRRVLVFYPVFFESFTLNHSVTVTWRYDHPFAWSSDHLFDSRSVVWRVERPICTISDHRPRAYSDSCRRPPPSARTVHDRTANRTNYVTVVDDPRPSGGEGNTYLVSVVWMCILVQLWTYPRLLQLLPIPVIYLCCKHLCESKSEGGDNWRQNSCGRAIRWTLLVPCSADGFQLPGNAW